MQTNKHTYTETLKAKGGEVSTLRGKFDKNVLISLAAAQNLTEISGDHEQHGNFTSSVALGKKCSG